MAKAKSARWHGWIHLSQEIHCLDSELCAALWRSRLQSMVTCMHQICTEDGADSVSWYIGIVRCPAGFVEPTLPDRRCVGVEPEPWQYPPCPCLIRELVVQYRFSDTKRTYTCKVYSTAPALAQCHSLVEIVFSCAACRSASWPS